MSYVIDDATSALHDTYDETTPMLDNSVPLGEFLDEQLARARENEIMETDNIDESDDEDSPPRYELPIVPEGYVMDEETARDLLACNDRSDLKKLLAKLKEKSLNARMKYDPAFATSPIFITDNLNWTSGGGGAPLSLSHSSSLSSFATPKKEKGEGNPTM